MSKIISEPMVRSTQTVNLSCIKISTISKQSVLSLGSHHLGVPSGASKMISKPMVRLAQNVHLSCTNTNTVCKQKEVRFHMIRHQGVSLVASKRFLSLWYNRRKPCSYLASRLALSPNGPKRASTSATSPSGTIECVQNDF